MKTSLIHPTLPSVESVAGFLACIPRSRSKQPRKAASLCLLTFLAIALAVPTPAQAQIATTVSFDPAIIGSNTVGTVQSVTGSGATRDVTVNLTSGTGEFKLRVLD